MELELGYDLLDLIMDVLELTIPQFGYFSSLCGFICYFKYISNFIIDSGLMGDDLWL